jgi:hypothetical protein
MSERTMRNLNLLFRFVLELVVLVALFLWGTSVSGEFIVQMVLGLGAPVLALATWGLFVAPRASRRLPDPQRLAVEIVVFGAGVLAFLARGDTLLALLLGAAAAISLGLMFNWGQRGH